MVLIGACEFAVKSISINSKPNYNDIDSFKGKWPKVMDGPEPSDILWQNLSVGRVSQAIRTFIVTIITIVMLILSIVGIVVSQYYQNEAANKFNIS
jgi:hypothetical protein